MHSITIYCPDDHLVYDRSVLDRMGIGGGATTRVRLAYALAEGGNALRLYINCPLPGSERGVDTCHFSGLERDSSEIFIASTSGPGLDLSLLKTIELEASLKILLVHGVTCPKGLEDFPFDYIYAPSNFIRRIAISEWGISPERLFVSHRGIQEQNFRRASLPGDRDPYALVYAGHPSKGLENAIAVFKYLHERDRRFSLHYYGGYGLWGQQEHPIQDPSISQHGIIGQVELARVLQACSFSLNIQERLEPFGMTIIEAMRAGCIVLASPVGAYPEIITHGVNGFLILGHPRATETHREAAELILHLVENREYARRVRTNAVHAPLTWEQVARTWEGHWTWYRSGKIVPATPGIGTCMECAGNWLPLADGRHCTRCGNYQRYPSHVPDIIQP